jgi:hypothetical protein
MAPKDRKRVDPNSNYGVDRAAKVAGRAAKSGGLYTRFVEIGRVVLIQFGESRRGKGSGKGRGGARLGGWRRARARAPRVCLRVGGQRAPRTAQCGSRGAEQARAACRTYPHCVADK